MSTNLLVYTRVDVFIVVVSEQTCLSNCMNLYLEAWNVVSRAYVSRAQLESRSGNL